MDPTGYQDENEFAGGWQGRNHFARGMAMNIAQQTNNGWANGWPLDMPPRVAPSMISGPPPGTNQMLPSVFSQSAPLRATVQSQQYLDTPSDYAQNAPSYNSIYSQGSNFTFHPEHRSQQFFTSDYFIPRQSEDLLRAGVGQPTTPEQRNALHQSAIFSRGAQENQYAQHHLVQNYNSQVSSSGIAARAYMMNQGADVPADALRTQQMTANLSPVYANPHPNPPAMNQQTSNHFANTNQRPIASPQSYLPANSQPITNYRFNEPQNPFSRLRTQSSGFPQQYTVQRGLSTNGQQIADFGVNGVQSHFSRAEIQNPPQRRLAGELIFINQNPSAAGLEKAPTVMTNYGANVAGQFNHRPAQGQASTSHRQSQNAIASAPQNSAVNFHQDQNQQYRNANPGLWIDPGLYQEASHLASPLAATREPFGNRKISTGQVASITSLTVTPVEVEAKEENKVLDEFVYFPKLPIELRTRIFKLADWNIPRQHALHIISITQIGNETSFFTPNQDKFLTKRSIKIRHVNHEARDAVKDASIYLNNIQNCQGLTVPIEFQPMKDHLVFNDQHGMDKVRLFYNLIGKEACSKIKKICKLVVGLEAHIWNGQGGYLSKPEDLAQIFTIFPGLETLEFLPVGHELIDELICNWKFGSDYMIVPIPPLSLRINYGWDVRESVWINAWHHHKRTLDDDSPAKESARPDFGLAKLSLRD